MQWFQNIYVNIDVEGKKVSWIWKLELILLFQIWRQGTKSRALVEQTSWWVMTIQILDDGDDNCNDGDDGGNNHNDGDDGWW